MVNNYALDNVRILDFSRVLAGPFCTMLLGDFGADVLKVERPILGDETRHWGPPWAGDDESTRLSAYFISANRNKRSMTLNLKAQAGQHIAQQLAMKSDILVENFKIGQMATYGLDYETLASENPRLIYCSITGYGSDSPYAKRPGYDFVIQGQSGLMSITGPQEDAPYKVGVAISDVVTGLFAANAILAALYHREKTGEGQHIEISLFDSQVASLVNVLSNNLISGEPSARYGNAHPNIVPYEAFEARDGWFILAVGNDGQFRQLCEVITRPDFAKDDRFRTNPARVANRAALIQLLATIFIEKPAAEWIRACLEKGIPAGEINSIAEMTQMPHVQARNLLQTIELASGVAATLLAPTPRLSKTQPVIHRPPPLLGQHTDEILGEMMNFDDKQLATYRALGVL